MSREEQERLHGVSLAQLAAVHAALAEPFPIRRVLALEGIEGPVYRQAEAAWKLRMAADAVTRERYQAEVGAAEDRLARIVKPLHEDAEAWAMFQAAYLAHPAEILRSTELGRNDVSRLQRFWAEQMAADDALKARVAAILARGPRGLPAVSPAPRELRPSPEARGGAPPAPPPTEAPPAPRVDADTAGLDVYVELTLDLEASPGDAARILERHGLPSDAARAALAARWEARFQAEPALRRDFRTLTAHYRAQRENARLRPEASAAAPPPRDFHPSVEVSHPVAPRSEETMDVGSLLSGPALPFHEGPSSSGARPAPGEAWDAPPPRSGPLAGATMDVGQLVSGSALPFHGGPEAPPVSSHGPPELSLEQYASLCVDLRCAPAAAAEILGRHGFTAESAPGLHARWRTRCADPAVYAAFIRACQEHEAHHAAGAPPSLSLEQYASLTVDLLLDPRRRAETLARYGVPEPQAPALDAAWSARFARDPAARATFNRASATYRDWLSRRGR